jgi:hypothetical protein
VSATDKLVDKIGSDVARPTSHQNVHCLIPISPLRILANPAQRILRSILTII